MFTVQEEKKKKWGKNNLRYLQYNWLSESFTLLTRYEPPSVNIRAVEPSDSILL